MRGELQHLAWWGDGDVTSQHPFLQRGTGEAVSYRPYLHGHNSTLQVGGVI